MQGCRTYHLVFICLVSLAHATQICLPKAFTLLRTVLFLVSSVDDINVEGRFSWLDISVLRLDFMNKVPVCSFSDAKIRHHFSDLYL